ncbi:hypothetical protein ACA910_013911 [Epithemia clementina (nom. ined.)]
MRFHKLTTTNSQQHHDNDGHDGDDELSLREQVRQTGAAIDKHILTLLSSSSCCSSNADSISDHGDDDDDDMSSDNDSAVDLVDLQRELDQAFLEEIPSSSPAINEEQCNDVSCQTNHHDKQVIGLNMSICTEDTALVSESDSSKHGKDDDKRAERPYVTGQCHDGVPTEVVFCTPVLATPNETSTNVLAVGMKADSQVSVLVPRKPILSGSRLMALGVVFGLVATTTLSAVSVGNELTSSWLSKLPTVESSTGNDVYMDDRMSNPSAAVPTSPPATTHRKRFKRNSRMLVVDRKYKAGSSN